MCQGARDAMNLSWKLTHVLKGEANESLLDTYGQERGLHVLDLTTTIKGIGRYICERDVPTAIARDAKLIAEAGGIVTAEPRQDLIPKLKTGFFVNHKHQAHGRLFPQPQIKDPSGTNPLLDDLVGGGWRLIVSSSTTDWDFKTIDTRALVDNISLKVLKLTQTSRTGYLEEKEGVAEQWFSEQQCLAAIVRPDHYVYAAANSVDELNRYLQQLATTLLTRDSTHLETEFTT